MSKKRRGTNISTDEYIDILMQLGEEAALLVDEAISKTPLLNHLKNPLSLPLESEIPSLFKTLKFGKKFLLHNPILKPALNFDMEAVFKILNAPEYKELISKKGTHGISFLLCQLAKCTKISLQEEYNKKIKQFKSVLIKVIKVLVQKHIKHRKDGAKGGKKSQEMRESKKPKIIRCIKNHFNNKTNRRHIASLVAEQFGITPHYVRTLMKDSIVSQSLFNKNKSS